MRTTLPARRHKAPGFPGDFFARAAYVCTHALRFPVWKTAEVIALCMKVDLHQHVALWNYFQVYILYNGMIFLVKYIARFCVNSSSYNRSRRTE